MTANRLPLACLLLALTTACGSLAASQSAPELPTLRVHFLEIVTPEVDSTCAALAKQHGVKFGKPDAALGNARLAELSSGGRLSVRAPMRETEDPVVRPYLLVDDIEAALKTWESAGAVVAMGATEIPGHPGRFAIVIHGGIQHGLWQL